jgi:hypothetical protein
MKHSIINYAWALLGLAFMAACTDEQGTEPGNDNTVVATIYQLDAKDPLNPDNDMLLRVATNNKTEAVYYAGIPKAEFETKMQQGGEEAIKDFVIASGTKVKDLSGGAVADVAVEGMTGEYKVAVVATGAGARALKVFDFIGLSWSDMATGTYTFALVSFGENKEKVIKDVVLQKCENREGLYRLNKVYNGSNNIKFTLLNAVQDDYQFVTVPTQATALNGVYIRDLATKENNQAFATDETKGCKLYNDNRVRLVLNYFTEGKEYGAVVETFVPNP